MTMSTYLVAFVVGPLEVTDPVDVDGTPLRVAHPPGKGHLTPFALEVRRRSRCASSPTTTASPTRATSSTWSPSPTSRSARWRTSAASRSARCCCSSTPTRSTPARAAAGGRRHQPRARPHVVRRPRDDEVVERHLAERGVRHVHGDEGHRRLPPRLGALGRLRPLAHRARSTSTPSTSTRPIEYQVVSPDDAEGMFDVLTYEKGAAVVRMLEQYLGEDDFRDGIRHYLRHHTSTATPRPPTCGTPSRRRRGEPVRRIMDSWIFQGGYPDRRARSSSSPNTLRLTPGAVPLSTTATREHDDHPGGGEQWSIP